MLYAHIVRSINSIGKIHSIKSQPLPEGYSFLIADQLPFRNELSIGGISVPLFAADHVAYFGEAVGLIVGPNPLIVEELAATAIVECENTVPCQDWNIFSSSDIAARMDYSREQKENEKRNDLIDDPPLDSQEKRGSDQTIYFDSFLQIEPQPFSFMSGLGALAEWDYDKLKLACPTLWPEHLRACVAKMMGASPRDVEIIEVQMYDSSEIYTWFPSLLAAQAAAAAWALKKPVKLLVSRKGEGNFLPQMHGISLHLRTLWSKKKRSLLHLECKFAVPFGAYPIFAKLSLEKAVHLAVDCIPKSSLEIHAFAVRTDSVPMGASECLSTSALYALLQSHLAQAARAMDAELTELFQNVFSIGGLSTREYPALKIALPLLRTTDFARKYSAFEQIFKRNQGGKEPTLRVIAFSLAYQNSQILMPSTAQKAQAQLTFDRTSKLCIESEVAFGSARLKESIQDQIADILKISVSQISMRLNQVSHPDTIPLISSSGIAIFSNLIRRGGERLQHKRFREGLPLSLHSYALIKPIKADNFGGIIFPSFGAAILQVEYDTRTSIIHSITMDVSVYAGKILSPSRAKASIRESCLKALGACLHANSFNNRSIDDIYSALLSKSVLNVNLIEDEKATIARPIGNLAYALVLSCFLSVLGQTTTSNRIHLPFMPTSPIAMREGTS